MVSRNRQLDLMRAIGIIAVVWGHNYQPNFLFFPVFQFHVSLFFFISGYFFKPSGTLNEKTRYLLKKTRRLLIPYLVFNLLFGILTTWLHTIHVNLGENLSLGTLFISPFGVGDQFQLYLSAWFLFNLYFICVFAGLIYRSSHTYNIAIAIMSAVLLMVLLPLGNQNNISSTMMFVIRSLFGFCFFSLGYFFKIYESRIQKYVTRPITCLFLFLISDALNTHIGDMSYTILFGTVGNKWVIAPIINSICIILLIYNITYYAAKVIKPNSIVHDIGAHSFAIMAFHFTFFFLVNVILYKFSYIPFAALSDVYYTYHKEQLWLVYQLPAICIPVLCMKYWNVLNERLNKKNVA